jgi:hypothetical protein
VTLIVAVACLALFGYTLRSVGLAEIADRVRRVGLGGFAGILALSGLRLAARSLAWMRCVEGEPRLRFVDAFNASVMGDALGNLTPLANVLSEPAKAVFVRHRVPLPVALPAIVVENIIYTVSVALMIGLGAVVFLLAFTLPEFLWVASVGALVGMALVVALGYLVLVARVRPFTGTIAWLDARGLRWGWVHARGDRVLRFEDSVTSFTSRNGRHLGPLALYEAAFHLAGVAEVYLTLALVDPSGVTAAAALVVESTGRVINVLFKFVPMRFGVDEAGNVLLARPLGLMAASLVTLALVRKARILVWTALGVGLLFRRGLTVRRALREAGRAASA